MADMNLNVNILGNDDSLAKAARRSAAELNKLNDVTSGISKGMSNAFRKIKSAFGTIGVAIGVGALVSGAQKAVNAASDLEQQFGAVESVFKSAAPEIKDFANQSVKLGLSTAEAAQSAALLGTMLKGAGLPMADVVAKSKQLVTLGADLAATYGGTTAEAVKALSSVFKGEFDPIERYGVSIKQSDINARLAAEGYSAAEIQTNKLARAQAAADLILEKTTDAQGQSTREANTYAGVVGRLKAAFTNLAAVIGTALMPVFQAVAGYFTYLVPKLADFYKQMTDPTTEIGAAWYFAYQQIIAFGKTFVTVMNQLGKNVSAAGLLNFVGKLFAGISQITWATGRLAAIQQLLIEGKDPVKATKLILNWDKDYKAFVKSLEKPVKMPELKIEDFWKQMDQVKLPSLVDNTADTIKNQKAQDRKDLLANFKTRVESLKSSYDGVIKDAKDMVKSFAQRLTDAVNAGLGLIESGESFIFSPDKLLNRLRLVAEQTKDFVRNIGRLREQGANEALIAQITAMDPLQGAITARGILESGKLGEISGLYGQLQATGTALGQAEAKITFNPQLDDITKELIDLNANIQSIADKSTGGNTINIETKADANDIIAALRTWMNRNGGQLVF